MAKLLFKLGKWSFLHKWVVIITWIILLAGTAVGSLSIAGSFSGQFTIEGTPSINAVWRLNDQFPDEPSPVRVPTVNLVFKAPQGQTLDEPQNMAAMDTVIEHIAQEIPSTKDEQRFGNPVKVDPVLRQTVLDMSLQSGLPQNTAERDAENLKMLSDDGTIGYTSFALDAPSAFEVPQEQRDIVNDAMKLGRDAGLQVEAGGAGFGDPIAVKGSSEVVGIIVAFLVLIFTFGSLVAAFLPIVTAIVGVGIGVLTIVGATHFVSLNNITPVLAIMIGLAVGIDYALFILSRYRAESKRMPLPDAAGMAVGTGGSAVVFAASTVIIALVALAVAKIGFLTAMGLSAAFTVFIALLVALTLIPALMGLFGEKAFSLKIPGIGGTRKKSRRRRRKTLGARVAMLIHRAPALVVAVVVLGLGALSTPVMQLELALPSDSTSNYSTTQRKSAELLKEGFGPGINAPFLFLVESDTVNPQARALTPLIEAQRSTVEQNQQPFNPAQAARLSSYLYSVQQVNALAEIRNAQIVNVNKDQSAAQIMITPYSGPADQETVKTAATLREVAREIEESTGAVVGLTGMTAVQMDITEALEKAMPIYLSVVVGLAIVLLLLVFRSIMVPLIAGLGFLLSVGAAFGATVLVWQKGLWGLVSTPAPLVSFMPIFLIGVTFGLAMDYQVFLVTRMREHYIRSGEKNNRYIPYNRVEESTIVGFSNGGRVVTAAALIMIAVFVAFIDQPLPFIQIFGFALGVGVFFDAFFIRMGLVPATMFLLGRATWWMPRWLDKILPHFDVEGENLERDMEERIRS